MLLQREPHRARELRLPNGDYLSDPKKIDQAMSDFRNVRPPEEVARLFLQAEINEKTLSQVPEPALGTITITDFELLNSAPAEYSVLFLDAIIRRSLLAKGTEFVDDNTFDEQYLQEQVDLEEKLAQQDPNEYEIEGDIAEFENEVSRSGDIILEFQRKPHYYCTYFTLNTLEDDELLIQVFHDVLPPQDVQTLVIETLKRMQHEGLAQVV